MDVGHASSLSSAQFCFRGGPSAHLQNKRDSSLVGVKSSTMNHNTDSK